MWFLWSVWHFIADGPLRLIGMRDRLRCPECSAVGTWKPHGGLFDREDVLFLPILMQTWWGTKRRRWMCKWCGWYRDERGVGYVRPNLEKKCWDFTGNGAADATPKELVGTLWPWRG